MIEIIDYYQSYQFSPPKFRIIIIFLKLLVSFMDIKYIIKEKMNFNIQELTDFQEQNKKPGNLNFTRAGLS